MRQKKEFYGLTNKKSPNGPWVWALHKIHSTKLKQNHSFFFLWNFCLACLPRKSPRKLKVERRRKKKRRGRGEMESQKKIAHEIGGMKNDALRFGLHGVKSDILRSHPLETAYESVINHFTIFFFFFIDIEELEN